VIIRLQNGVKVHVKLCSFFNWNLDSLRQLWKEYCADWSLSSSFAWSGLVVAFMHEKLFCFYNLQAFFIRVDYSIVSRLQNVISSYEHLSFHSKRLMFSWDMCISIWQFEKGQIFLFIKFYLKTFPLLFRVHWFFRHISWHPLFIYVCSLLSTSGKLSKLET